ncbi:MAG: hypothetical protein KAI83_09365 [Thiomargarita sp.]|nr:hypothetical protein [Thiomargarita sp.]
MSSNCARKTISIKPIKLANEQHESNNKHACSGQCENCPRCSSNKNKKN